MDREYPKYIVDLFRRNKFVSHKHVQISPKFGDGGLEEGSNFLNFL